MLGVIFVHLTICTGWGAREKKLANHYYFNFTPGRPSKIYDQQAALSVAAFLNYSFIYTQPGVNDLIFVIYCVM